MISSGSYAAAFTGRSEGNPDTLMPRLLPVLLMTVALAGCSTAASAAPAAGPTAGADWSAEVLAVVRPLAERRLTTGTRAPGAGHPLLSLGLDALGRASSEPRYTAAAGVLAGTGPLDQPPVALDSLCTAGTCSAADLLQRPELWAGPGVDPSVRSGVAGLDPSFRRMAAALFDREALLFHTDERTASGSTTDRDITGHMGFESTLNATAFVAMTRMVDALPAEDPARLEYVALYREMARTITRVQGDDGWWRETLADPASPVDRSASALFVFGLTWGLNTGMLSFNEGETAALKGWNALKTPAALEALEAGDAGLGALMLASSEMAERRW